MAHPIQKKSFVDSENGQWLRHELELMVESSLYNTSSTYTATQIDKLTFIDKHINYVCKFPYINCQQYISNLKLKTKI